MARRSACRRRTRCSAAASHSSARARAARTTPPARCVLLEPEPVQVALGLVVHRRVGDRPRRATNSGGGGNVLPSCSRTSMATSPPRVATPLGPTTRTRTRPHRSQRLLRPTDDGARRSSRAQARACAASGSCASACRPGAWPSLRSSAAALHHLVVHGLVGRRPSRGPVGLHLAVDRLGRVEHGHGVLAQLGVVRDAVTSGVIVSATLSVCILVGTVHLRVGRLSVTLPPWISNKIHTLLADWGEPRVPLSAGLRGRHARPGAATTPS